LEVLKAEATGEAIVGFTATREEVIELRQNFDSDLCTSSLPDEAPLLAPVADSASVFLLPSKIDAF